MPSSSSSMPPDFCIQAAYELLCRERLGNRVFVSPTGTEVLQLARDLQERVLQIELAETSTRNTSFSATPSAASQLSLADVAKLLQAAQVSPDSQRTNDAAEVLHLRKRKSIGEESCQQSIQSYASDKNLHPESNLKQASKSNAPTELRKARPTVKGNTKKKSANHGNSSSSDESSSGESAKDQEEAASSKIDGKETALTSSRKRLKAAPKEKSRSNVQSNGVKTKQQSNRKERTASKERKSKSSKTASKAAATKASRTATKRKKASKKKAPVLSVAKSLRIKASILMKKDCRGMSIMDIVLGKISRRESANDEVEHEQKAAAAAVAIPS